MLAHLRNFRTMAAVPLLEVGFRISPHVLPSCISGFFLVPSVLYVTFSQLPRWYALKWDMCYQHVGHTAEVLQSVSISSEVLALEPAHGLVAYYDNQSALLLLFFFFLQSDTSEVSAFFSYGESGIDGDRQSRGPHHFSLSYLASTIKCFLRATNYHHTRV